MNDVWRVVRRIVQRKRRVAVATTRQAYIKHREYARGVITDFVSLYAARYHYQPKRIAIRHTRRRWGSCSAAGNLNFSYKVAFLPPCMARYIVVHELCHLDHLHHRQSFWVAVAAVLPDYADRVAAIRAVEKTTGTSLEALTRWRTHHDATLCPHCIFDARVSQDATSSGILSEL
jgi:predicted metal-dependent hydrolase